MQPLYGFVLSIVVLFLGMTMTQALRPLMRSSSGASLESGLTLDSSNGEDAGPLVGNSTTTSKNERSMRRSYESILLSIAVLALGVSAVLVAQDAVPSLQDLVGARGAAIDEIERRGYTYQRTEKEADSAYSYWRENENGQCVVARVSDGRVPPSSMHRAATAERRRADRQSTRSSKPSAV